MPVDQRKESILRRIFGDIFDAAFPTSDIEGVGLQFGDLGFGITDLGSNPSATDIGLSAPGLSTSGITSDDLPAREINTIDGGYDALSRRQRYASYDQIEELVPEVHAALNTYADEVCSYDDRNHTLQISCSNEAVKDELEFLFFDQRMIDFDNRIWMWTRNLCKLGDSFFELVIDPKNPTFGVLKINELDPHTMWRIQSKRNTLLEFQQTLTVPDYDVVAQEILEKHSKDKDPYESIFWRGRDQYTRRGLVRFAPAQVIHIAIGAGERGYKPYGVSILQAARRAAYNLRLMEDSMLLYRLTRGTERRVYYIDVGQMAGAKVDSYVEEFKKRTKRRRVYNERTQQVDERYNPWSVDDDLYLPIRSNTNTRVESLPGASNLSDIDDALYFRKKLYVALKIPPGYLEQTIEAQTNRLSLTSLDMRFAKVIYRVQKAVSQAMREVAIRHLTLMGVPTTLFEDLEITMTPSSEWREMAKSEVLQARITMAQTMQGMQMHSDRFIMTQVLKMTDDAADREISARKKQDVEKAELEGVKLVIAARYQAEIERGTAVNQAAIQAAQTGGGEAGAPMAETPEAGGPEAGIPEAIPGEEEFAAAAVGPEEVPVPEKASPKEKTIARRISMADIEAEREEL